MTIPPVPPASPLPPGPPIPPLPPPALLATVGGAPPPAAAPPIPPFGLPGLEGPLLAALGLGLLLGAHRHVAPNCRPDQILVIAGRGRRRHDGQRIGYRVVHGGRALMVPWLEHRRWMDVRSRAVPIRVTKAYALGGTPIDVEAISTVKISTDPVCVGNAIERFLGHEADAVQEVAARTLEGHLRLMVAGLTPEQVNQDRLRFADRVLEVTRPDMTKLGLQVDTFKILRVSDGVDYLDSLGRARLAEVLRDAAVAEAEGFGDAEQREAQAEERSEVAATTARTVVQERDNELRTIRARLDEEIRTAEERVEAVAAEARARAEKALQTLRAELERQRLEADVVLPARAREQAEDWRRRGAAAPTLEDARASAAVNDQLAALWREAGDQAGSIFVLQQLETVLREAASLAGQLQLGRITALETGNPADLANLASLHPAVMRTFLDQVRDTLGIDVLQALNPHRTPQP
ncbi:MAG: flotillin family protein [Synechococcaceae cyanobacterium]